MTIVQFTGRIFGSKLTMKGPLQLRASPQLVGPAFDAKITITDSIVTAECDVPRYEDKDLMNLLLQVKHLVSSVVDLVTLRSCTSLSVVFDTVQVGSRRGPLTVRGPAEIDGLCTFDIEKDLPDVLSLVVGEPHLAMALRDLVSSISNPDDSVVSCARAIEGIRHLIADLGVPVTMAWTQMRERLNLDRSYIQPVMSHSVQRRHGKKDYVTPEIYTDVMARSWTIMNRFLEYRRRGSQRLPISEFPILGA